MILNLSMIFIVYILSGRTLNILTHAEPLTGNNVTRVEDGKYSLVVSIAKRNNRSPGEVLHICTGVLVTNKLVLTAAHCLDEESTPAGIQLIAGSVDLREAEKYNVKKWITYNQWAESKNISRKNSNDIAILKLSYRVSSRIARPAILLYQKTYDLYDKFVVIVGWGTTNESPDIPSRHLHETKVKVLRSDVCENISHDVFRKKFVFSNKYLCTKGHPYTFLAKGDSGGPVLWKDSVVAISGGTCPQGVPCDLPEEAINNNRFNLHLGIDFFQNFINDVLKNY